ncbi:MAG: hypothetical protein N3F08_00700, partial [Crenarchaeota archaeon]|nr:hypothetical protein [Thermoproteota archaeon]
PFYELVFLSPSYGFVSVYKVNYNSSYGEESLVLGSSPGTALRNSSKLYSLPLIPGVSMAVNIKRVHVSEGTAEVGNASIGLKANASLIVKVNGEVKKTYPAFPGKYRLTYRGTLLEIMVNGTLVETLPLREGVKSIEAGFLQFAEGVEGGNITSYAFSYVVYEVRIEVP